jgi:hypothetical protein
MPLDEDDTQHPLPAPFAAIFGDRATADWAFDLFARTVERLGGGPNDPRFALTLPRDRTMLRLILGNWLVMDVSARAGVMHLTALVEPMVGAFSFPRSEPYARSDDSMAVFTVPLDTARAWPEELRRVYEESMIVIAERFSTPPSGSDC